MALERSEVRRNAKAASTDGKMKIFLKAMETGVLICICCTVQALLMTMPYCRAQRTPHLAKQLDSKGLLMRSCTNQASGKKMLLH